MKEGVCKFDYNVQPIPFVYHVCCTVYGDEYQLESFPIEDEFELW